MSLYYSIILILHYCVVISWYYFQHYCIIAFFHPCVPVLLCSFVFVLVFLFGFNGSHLLLNAVKISSADSFNVLAASHVPCWWLNPSQWTRYSFSLVPSRGRFFSMLWTSHLLPASTSSPCGIINVKTWKLEAEWWMARPSFGWQSTLAAWVLIRTCEMC